MNGSKVANYGHAFEKRALQAFIRNGYAYIDSNKWTRNNSFLHDRASKREFDLILFNTYERQFYIVECKAHVNPLNLVGLAHVELFSMKLEQYGGEHAVGLIVTDTDFSEVAKKYGNSKKLKLMSGFDFCEFERNGSWRQNARSRIFSYGLRKFNSALEKTVLSF